MQPFRTALLLTIMLLTAGLVVLGAFTRLWIGHPALAHGAPATTSGTFAIASSPAHLLDEPIHYPQCPANLQTPEQMAAVIGGDAGDWTVPEGWWGGWTLRSAEFEHLVWPGQCRHAPAARRRLR
jgi:hypothetical protein